MNRAALSLVAFVPAIALIGAGCQKTEFVSSAPVSAQESSAAEEGATPADAWKEYEDAVPLASSLRETTFTRAEGNVRVSIPASWTQEGVVWHSSSENKLDHIRIAHFSNEGPMTAWDAQKKLDVHEVVHAELLGGKYLLMVNHPTLRATIFKVFIPDLKMPGDAYYFFECRAGYEGDRAAVWSACKTAYDGLKIE